MARRLRADRRPLVARTAARSAAERLTAVGQLGLVALVVAVTTRTAAGWSNDSAAVSPLVAQILTGLLLTAAVATIVAVGRGRLHARNSWALAAVVLTAVLTELLLRGFALGAMSELPVTVSVLVTALATGALQAWRSPRGRAEAAAWATVLGFVLGLVATVTGSVLAAVALHVAVSAVSWVHTLPRHDAVAGCSCGHDHSAGAVGTGGAVTATTGAPVTAATGTGAAVAAGTAATAPATVETSDATSRLHPPDRGDTCSHGGTVACATCPLSTARV